MKNTPNPRFKLTDVRRSPIPIVLESTKYFKPIDIVLKSLKIGEHRKKIIVSVGVLMKKIRGNEEKS